MLEQVEIGARSIEAYRGVAPDAIIDDLVDRAAQLRGARVLHVNATPYGGGVSELLRSVVPLLNDLGLVAHWKIIAGDGDYFQVTKKIHNALQGLDVELTERERETYLTVGRRNAELLDEEYDFVFLHDPQTAAIPALRGRGGARWIWRCHIDTSAPNPEIWTFIRDYLEEFDAAVFTMQAFVPADVPTKIVDVVPPAIDPISPKNMSLPEEVSRRVLDWIGARPDRPLVTQVSRFDPWKDPLGVIAAFREARKAVPNLELALVGSMALDDPEGWTIYREIEAASRSDPSIHLFTNLSGVGNIEVNAFQRMSDVVIQKSLREGFGLVVSEALWKQTPVVAGRVGGIPLQMADGVGGVLVDEVNACAAALVSLLADRDRRQALGELGRARVRQHFLIPRLILNELELMERLASARPIGRDESWRTSRDLVCGMLVSDPAAAPSAAVARRTYRFCSEACRLEFLDNPSHYGTVMDERGTCEMEESS